MMGLWERYELSLCYSNPPTCFLLYKASFYLGITSIQINTASFSRVTFRLGNIANKATHVQYIGVKNALENFCSPFYACSMIANKAHYLQSEAYDRSQTWSLSKIHT